MIMESILQQADCKERDWPSATDIVSLALRVWLFAICIKIIIWTYSLYICTRPMISTYSSIRCKNILNMHTTLFGFCGSTGTYACGLIWNNLACAYFCIFRTFDTKYTKNKSNMQNMQKYT